MDLARVDGIQKGASFRAGGKLTKVAIAIPSIPGEFCTIFYKTPKDIDILIV